MSLSSLQLDAFFEVSQVRSFSQAAKNLFITQSALSQRIMKLEGDLGVTLVIRESSGIRLTDVGEELLRYCQMRQQLEGEFVSRTKGRDSKKLSGRIRLAGFSSVMRSAVLPSLKEMILSQGEVKVELMTREMRELPELLKNGQVDFILLDRASSKEGIKSVLLGEEKNVLIEPTASRSCADVYLDHDAEDEMTKNYLKYQGMKTQDKKQIRLERSYLDEIYGVIDGVAMGLGRAVVPQHLVRNLKSVKAVDGQKSVSTSVFLLFYEQPYYSRLHHQVVEALTQNAPRYLD